MVCIHLIFENIVQLLFVHQIVYKKRNEHNNLIMMQAIWDKLWSIPSIINIITLCIKKTLKFEHLIFHTLLNIDI
jgi:hypothetical protein